MLPELMIPDRLFDVAARVARVLRDHGRQAYFVGGAVRDRLLGRPLKDIDIATNARPEEVMALFPRTHAIGAAFGIVTVVEEDLPFEVATFREEREYADGRHPERISYSDSPERDAIRRDFTVNGLFLDPLTGKILDFVGGLEDLRRGALRTIGDARERFSEDYLRILRAVRFAVRLDLTIDPALAAAAREMAPSLDRLSAERVRDELTKIFIGPRPEKGLDVLSDFAALNVLLPEVEAMKGVPQPPKFHPEGDVYVHTRLALSMMTLPTEELAWAVLLHDIGKPLTLSRKDDGQETFYCHDRLGAEMTETVLRRLRFSNKTIEHVTHAVRDHMRYAHVDKARPATIRRLMAAPTFSLELELHRLDCAASHRKLDNYLLLLDRLIEISGETQLPPPLLSGKDLIELNMTPGPVFGKILRTVAEAQYAGQIRDRNEALELVRKLQETLRAS